jgi:transcriptional regulator GlxA family with amidase domain
LLLFNVPVTLSPAQKNTIGNVAKFSTDIAMKVGILIVNHCFDTGLATIVDAFSTANELAQMSGMRSPRFELEIIGVRRSVTTANGLTVPVVPPKKAAPDLVIVPAIGYKVPDQLEKALARQEVRDTAELLRKWKKGKHTIAAGCIGTFILAESGLLDGETATTTWWLAPFFRQRYPRISLDASKMVVQSGRFVTSGAALSHIDLALHLIRQKSPMLADLVARYLIVDTRPLQSAYALSDHFIHSDPIVHKFERWARSEIKNGFSLDAAALAVGASKRTLARKVQLVLGQTPLSYFPDIRVEQAVHLLKTTPKSVEEIAEEVGYADGATLRILLRKRLGQGIKSIKGGIPA